MWQIAGSFGPYARSGYDASGWLWEIEREEKAKRVLVEVTRTASAVAPDHLPDDTRRAIETEGQSEVIKILDMDEPPRVIVCGTAGCRHVGADELSG